MSRKQYSKELKLELVKKHLEDGISYWKLGKEYGIEASIIRRWGYKYETFGEDGLEKQNADLCNYSAEFKKKIVRLHLEEGRSLKGLAAEYGVSKASISNWTKQFREECQINEEAQADYDFMKENLKLKRQLAELQKENDFLK